MSKKGYLFKILSVIFALVLTFSFPICIYADETTASEGGAAEPSYAALDLLNTDLSPYIKLGQYKDIDITFNVAVTDEQLYNMAVQNNVYTEVKSRATQSGDLINVSWVGKAALSSGKLISVRGGTSSGKITVGSKAEGADAVPNMLCMSEKLIGVMPGSSVDITLDIPSDYAESAMAGRRIIFTVTVNSIIEYGFTDEYVASKYGCESLEDYKLVVIKETLKNFEELLRYDVYLHIVKNSTVIQYPTEHYNYYYDAEIKYYKSYYESNAQYAATYGSFEKFLEAYGTSVEQIEERAKIQTEKDLICFAVYKTGVFGTITDAEYEAGLAKIAKENNTTVSALETMYAGRYDLSNLVIADYTYSKLGTLAKLTTDYNDYAYLLEEDETTDTGAVTSPVVQDGNAPAIDSNVILMIVIIAVGFVGCVVLLIVQKKLRKKEAEAEDDGEEYDDEDDSYEDEFDEEPSENDDTEDGSETKEDTEN